MWHAATESSCIFKHTFCNSKSSQMLWSHKAGNAPKTPSCPVQWRLIGSVKISPACFFFNCHCPEKQGQTESVESSEREERCREGFIQIWIKIPAEICLAVFQQRGWRGLKWLIQIPVNHLVDLTSSWNWNRCKKLFPFYGIISCAVLCWCPVAGLLERVGFIVENVLLLPKSPFE